MNNTLLDENYLDNIKNISNNLNKNSSILKNDLDKLNLLIIEIHKYQEKGIDISQIIITINKHICDITKFLEEFFNNLKLLDNKLHINTLKLKHNTDLIINDKHKQTKSCCCCNFLL